MKIQKHIVFPKELHERILQTDKVPQYLDFTTKIFMLLEMALAEDGVKKNETPIRLAEEKRHAPRHRKAS